MESTVPPSSPVLPGACERSFPGSVCWFFASTSSAVGVATNQRNEATTQSGVLPDYPNTFQIRHGAERYQCAWLNG